MNVLSRKALLFAGIAVALGLCVFACSTSGVNEGPSEQYSSSDGVGKLSSSSVYSCRTPQETDSTFTDSRDCKEYKVRDIGNGAVWFMEDLTVDVILNEYMIRKGGSYNWEEAMEVCPDGWHLPDDEEWEELVNSWGRNREYFDTKKINWWSATGAESNLSASRWHIVPYVGIPAVAPELMSTYIYEYLGVRCVKDFSNKFSSSSVANELSSSSVYSCQTPQETDSTFTDPRDCKEYKVRDIGNGAVWFVEDLVYNGETKYTWNEATKVCPNGWHLPNNNEWDFFDYTLKGEAGIYFTSGLGWWSSSTTYYSGLPGEPGKDNGMYVWLISERWLNIDEFIFKLAPNGFSYLGDTDLYAIRCMKDK